MIRIFDTLAFSVIKSEHFRLIFETFAPAVQNKIIDVMIGPVKIMAELFSGIDIHLRNGIIRKVLADIADTERKHRLIRCGDFQHRILSNLFTMNRIRRINFEPGILTQEIVNTQERTFFETGLRLDVGIIVTSQKDSPFFAEDAESGLFECIFCF